MWSGYQEAKGKKHQLEASSQHSKRKKQAPQCLPFNGAQAPSFHSEIIHGAPDSHSFNFGDSMLLERPPDVLIRTETGGGYHGNPEEGARVYFSSDPTTAV